MDGLCNESIVNGNDVVMFKLESFHEGKLMNFSELTRLFIGLALFV